VLQQWGRPGSQDLRTGLKIGMVPAFLTSLRNRSALLDSRFYIGSIFHFISFISYEIKGPWLRNTEEIECAGQSGTVVIRAYLKLYQPALPKVTLEGSKLISRR
jgi:hypothetical protein